ncbi:MAG TPA: CopD family protein [Methylomirabilota bacterium]|nr:CopD family protein [Methylomirabilota bacterium]
MLLTLHDFLAGILRAIVLLGFAVAAGGVLWGVAVLRAPRGGDGSWRAAKRCLDIVAVGAVILAAAQLAALVLQNYLLSVTLARPAIDDLLGTAAFRAGLARIVVALALVVTIWRLRATPAAAGGWTVVGVLGAFLAASGAWLTHAAGRLDNSGLLMLLTVAHQVAAAAWLGGLVQLGALWQLTRRDAHAAAAWPTLVRRFSGLAAAAVAVLLLSALPLTWAYTQSWRALIGTGYGSLVITKAGLLVAVLGLAFIARRIARAGRVDGNDLRERLPRLAEAETILLVIILFAATSLSAQPPAADHPAVDTADIADVVEVFRPKVPSLQAPSVEAMRRSRGEMTLRKERTREAYLWSNFSHNVSGLILLGTGLFALIALAHGRGADRHWPLGLIALAVFVYLRAAANEGAWPFGTTPLWDIDAEGLQHRMAAALVLALGFIEWRARAQMVRVPALPYVLPALAGAGAVLLLTHSHAAFQSKASFLVQVTHSTMGAGAALLAAARWLELRLTPPASRWAGAAASLAMVGIALVLIFYREANFIFND